MEAIYFKSWVDVELSCLTECWFNKTVKEFYHKDPGKGDIRKTPRIDFISDVLVTNNSEPI